MKAKAKAKPKAKSKKPVKKPAVAKAKPKKRAVAKKKKPATRVKVAKPAGRYPRWSIAIPWLVPFIAIALVLTVEAFRGKGHSTQPESKPYGVALTSARLMSMSQEAQLLSLGDRIAYWSGNLLRDPGLLSPLAPGPKVDDVAAVFPSDYDCTTFVETVGALSKAPSIEDWAREVIAIRYAGDVASYDSRNHFPEADWIPHNQAKGILKDITTDLMAKAGMQPTYVAKVINRGVWLTQQKDRPATRQIAAEDAQVKNVNLAYVPIESVSKVLKDIPQGAVVNIVRSSRPKFPVLISHQGFLIWKDGEAYFRHASRNKEIRDTRFVDYVRQIRNHPWKVIGFNVNAYQG